MGDAWLDIGTGGITLKKMYRVETCFPEGKLCTSWSDIEEATRLLTVGQKAWPLYKSRIISNEEIKRVLRWLVSCFNSLRATLIKGD